MSQYLYVKLQLRMCNVFTATQYIYVYIYIYIYWTLKRFSVNLYIHIYTYVHYLLVFPWAVGEASLLKCEVGIDLSKQLKRDWFTRSSSCANNLNSHWWLVRSVNRINNNVEHFHTLGWWGSNNSETCLTFGILSCNNFNILCVISIS